MSDWAAEINRSRCNDAGEIIVSDTTLSSSLSRRDIFLGGALVTIAVASGGPAFANSVNHNSGAGDPSPIKIISMPQPVPAREEVAHLDGVDIWYWDTGGAGEPIVLLHPLTSSGHCWGYQQPVFARAGYRVIGYSRRGYRGSTNGDAEGRPSDVADFLALVNHLKLERFHTVGSAGGALIAAAFAIKYPQRVRSLTVANWVIRPKDPAFEAISTALAEPGLKNMPEDFRELGVSYRAVNPTGRARWRELHDRAHEGNAPLGLNFGDPVTEQSLSGVRAPTLVLTGDADLLAPPPISRLIARAIAKSEIVVLTESGHSSYWERPDQFNAAVLSFIRRHSL